MIDTDAIAANTLRDRDERCRSPGSSRYSLSGLPSATPVDDAAAFFNRLTLAKIIQTGWSDDMETMLFLDGGAPFAGIRIEVASGDAPAADRTSRAFTSKSAAAAHLTRCGEVSVGGIERRLYRASCYAEQIGVGLCEALVGPAAAVTDLATGVREGRFHTLLLDADHPVTIRIQIDERGHDQMVTPVVTLHSSGLGIAAASTVADMIVQDIALRRRSSFVAAALRYRDRLEATR